MARPFVVAMEQRRLYRKCPSRATATVTKDLAARRRRRGAEEHSQRLRIWRGGDHNDDRRGRGGGGQGMGRRS